MELSRPSSLPIRAQPCSCATLPFSCHPSLPCHFLSPPPLCFSPVVALFRRWLVSPLQAGSLWSASRTWSTPFIVTWPTAASWGKLLQSWRKQCPGEAKVQRHIIIITSRSHSGRSTDMLPFMSVHSRQVTTCPGHTHVDDVPYKHTVTHNMYCT